MSTLPSKERVSTADLEACRSWLVARGDSLARSRDMILMVDELLERRSSETPATQDPLGYAYEVDGVMVDSIYHEQRDAEIFAKEHRAAGRQAEVIPLYERPANETGAGLQIVAFVPVHPKHGPLWANVVTSQDADRPAHYPMIPLYARIEAPAQKAGESRAEFERDRGFVNRCLECGGEKTGGLTQHKSNCSQVTAQSEGEV